MSERNVETILGLLFFVGLIALTVFAFFWRIGHP